jgi:imidazoleglycerol-phosphate dehydratase
MRTTPVEDIGSRWARALAARGSATRRAWCAYGHAYVPLDEALSRVVVDLSGTPGLE